jgi:hypothetical protein
MVLNTNFIMERVAECQPGQSQVQTTSSTSPTTDPHDRSGTRPIAVSHLADAPFILLSDAQASTLSDACALLQTGLNQLQAVNQTPTARSAARSALEKEMDAARRLARSMLSRRNARAPISALPPELLA